MTTPSIAAIVAKSDQLTARGRALRAAVATAFGYDAQPQPQPATTDK